jgi:hypothetical protein
MTSAGGPRWVEPCASCRPQSPRHLVGAGSPTLWARVALRGVRTRGSAGADRLETYGATDHHVIEAVRGAWRGRDLGGLTKVLPEPGFGFGSTPPTPSVTTLVTTVLDGPPVSA